MTVGVLLAILSLGVLIFFIHHVATSIQASRIIANVAADLEGAIDRQFPDTIGDGAPTAEGAAGAEEEAVAGDEGRPVITATTGYVQAIDAARLLTIAREHDVLVRVRARPGSFVRKGSVLLTVTPPPVPDVQEDDGPFRDAFIIGSNRTGTQDLTFFVDQLVELAVRALSPGINDPGTARLCVDRLEQALCHLAARQIPSAARYDDSGRVRVFACPLTFADIVESAFNEIARYGRSSVSVTCRLLEAVRNVGTCVEREPDRRALLRQATVIASGIPRSEMSDSDRELIERCRRAALLALHVKPGDAPARGRRPLTGRR